MKTITPRARALIFAGLALLALMALAATLNALELDPGSPLPLWELGPRITGPAMPESLEELALAALRIMMILFWVMLPIFLLLMIFSKQFRKQFLRDMAIITPILILVYLIFRPRGQGEPLETLEEGGGFNLGDLEGSFGDPDVPVPVYTPPDPWVTDLITLVIAVLVVLIVAGLGWTLYNRTRAQKVEPLRRIQNEAQAALDEIEAGGDLRDVIMRAYLQMIQALKKLRNIHRDQHMTPHEFESYLAARGLPREPVHQLTQLFEQVRYGGITPGRADERAAVASLSAIVAACERQRKERA